MAPETIQVSPCAPMAMGFPRADKMVIQKRWSYAGCIASGKRNTNFWKCAISPGGETTKDDGEATDTATDDRVPKDAGNDTLAWLLEQCWPEVENRPKFDGGLKEFTKIHEAQSRKIKDEDDADLDMNDATLLHLSILKPLLVSCKR